VCFFDLVVGKARLRYRSLLLTTNFKVALQVESTIGHLLTVRLASHDKWKMRNEK
jgi:hypothetical protein